ncbi:hypothetical protein KM043_017843 [Ampulex compressa]|nr:hypothetical protein KM043_017843 [Ampulex compressa]
MVLLIHHDCTVVLQNFRSLRRLRYIVDYATLHGEIRARDSNPSEGWSGSATEPRFQGNPRCRYVPTDDQEDDNVEADPGAEDSKTMGGRLRKICFRSRGAPCSPYMSCGGVSQSWQRQDVDEAAWCTVLCPCRS